MKNNITRLLFSQLCLFIATTCFAEHHETAASFQRTPITESIDMLSGKGGNIGVLRSDQGLLLIDDDYTEMSSALVAALEKVNDPTGVIYVINTHWHGDHTGGNEHLGTQASIIAHDNVRKRLLTSQEIKLFNMVSEPYPEVALPDITYSQSMTLHFGGEEINLVHYAHGHTDGDSVVFFTHANVVHMGDHFFNGFFPFIDIDSGGNVVTMAENIKDILSQINDRTVVIPGHGPISNKAELTAFHDMLVGTTEDVKTLINAGLNLEAIQAHGLGERWQPWTSGFISSETWISLIYKSLSVDKH